MPRADRFVKACRREPVDCTPVWMMRQAGRYLPEYREIREKHTFLEMCKTPELAAEVTIQPVRRYEIDAAIIFADILLPLEPMGIGLEFAKGEGPVIHNPVRTMTDVEKLKPVDSAKSIDYLMKVRGILTQEQLRSWCPELEIPFFRRMMQRPDLKGPMNPKRMPPHERFREE